MQTQLPASSSLTLPVLTENCPKCGTEVRIELTQALVGPYLAAEKQLLTERMQQEKEAREAELQQQHGRQMEDLREELEQARMARELAEENERKLIKRQRELDDREQHLELEMERRLLAERETAELEIQQRLQVKFDQERISLTEKLQASEEARSQAEESERKLRKQREELEEREQQLDLEVERRLTTAREEAEAALEQRLAQAVEQEKKLHAERLRAAEEAQDRTIVELRKQQQSDLEALQKPLRDQLKAEQQRRETAEKHELELLQQREAIEERGRNLQLEIERTVAEKAALIREQEAKRLEEDHMLQLRDRELVIEQLKDALNDAKRKAEQGSQQIQGESLELLLQEQLLSLFPEDELLEVPKGIKGGDVIQRVRDHRRQPCGDILWECKRAKVWQKEWLPKLRENAREAKSELAVIVSTVLPKDITNFGYVDGVWISNLASYGGLATALRLGLLETAQARASMEGRQTKSALVYDYVSGAEFRHRIEGLAEALNDLQRDLREEQRAMEKRWAKREKQIHRAILGTVGLFGDVQGIVGSDLKELPSLSLMPGETTDD